MNDALHDGVGDEREGKYTMLIEVNMCSRMHKEQIMYIVKTPSIQLNVVTSNHCIYTQGTLPLFQQTQ